MSEKYQFIIIILSNLENARINQESTLHTTNCQAWMETVRIWWIHLLQFPQRPLPPRPGLETVLVLNDLFN